MLRGARTCADPYACGNLVAFPMLRTVRRQALSLFGLAIIVTAACSAESSKHDSSGATGGSAGKATTGGTGGNAPAAGASGRGALAGDSGSSSQIGAGTSGSGALNGGSAGLGGGGAGGIQAAGSGGTSGTGGVEAPGGSGGEGGDAEEGLGVRFIGFVSEVDGADLPCSSEFLTRFPECAAETSTQYPPFPRFNECFARGIVRLMNESLAELIPNAPHFRFQSLEIIADDRLATFHSDPSYSGYELQHLLGSKYRVNNTMTFLMPTVQDGPTAGLVWTEDERLSPDFGMAAIVVPAAGSTVFLHEFGHGVGFPHATNAANVEPDEYQGCGGVTVEPPACACETQNFMEIPGSFAASSGCEPCTDVPNTTFDTDYFGPKFAAIAACWVTRRLEPSDIGFVDGDCFGLVDSSISTCKEMEGVGVTCVCPSGQVFVVDDCTDASQDARNAATSEACDRITCPPPPERPGVVCKALAGAPSIWCTCEDPSQGFSLGSDCSALTLDAIERLCPPI